MGLGFKPSWGKTFAGRGATGKREGEQTIRGQRGQNPQNPALTSDVLKEHGKKKRGKKVQRGGKNTATFKIKTNK